MSRKRTGLRNKYRTGGGSYAQRRKVNGADRYGRPESGKITDVIAGHLLTYPIGK